MNAIAIGWYLPMFVLMGRDPLVREVVKDVCKRGSTTVLSALVVFIRWGGVTLFRKAAKGYRAACRPPAVLRTRDEPWHLVEQTDWDCTPDSRPFEGGQNGSSHQSDAASSVGECTAAGGQAQQEHQKHEKPEGLLRPHGSGH